MCALLCKELGAQNVTAKASNANHAAVLTKLGVDRVVFPEADSAEKAATLIAYPQISDMVQLRDDLCIVEMDTPASWHNKTLMELKIRERYGVTVIFLLQQGEALTPAGDSVIKEGGTIVLGGPMDKLETVLSRYGQ